jgi:hypothetical protein
MRIPGPQAAAGWRRAALLLATTAASLAGAAPVTAQEILAVDIIRGRSVSGQPAGVPLRTQVVRGMRVESPSGSWTEIAFADRTTIVLEQGGDFTLQSVRREGGPRGRLIIAGVAGRGIDT